MWWTELGKRTLTGAERELFVRMAYALWQDLEEELSDEKYASTTGVAAFDRLSVQQRFVILAEITAGLLDRKVRCVPLTQANEAAIAAVFQVGGGRLVDCDMYKDFRHLVRAAAKQSRIADLPPLRALNYEYDELVECLRDRILWDTDFAMEAVALDLPPDESRQLHGEMGIMEDYFTTLVPDPREVRRPRSLLEQYLGRPTRNYLPDHRVKPKKTNRATRRRQSR